MESCFLDQYFEVVVVCEHGNPVSESHVVLYTGAEKIKHKNAMDELFLDYGMHL